MVHNKSEMRATGGGINKYIILSPLEEAVANLLQFEKQINPEGAAYGVPEVPQVPESFEELVAEVLAVDPDIEQQTTVHSPEILVQQEEPSTSRNGNSSRATPSGSMSASTLPLRAATPVNRKKPSDRQNLLEKHNNMQEKVLTDISNTLVSIKRNIKDTYSYQKKLFEVEEKKLKLMEKKEKRENEFHASDMKIRSLKIRIKEEELSLLGKQNCK